MTYYAQMIFLEKKKEAKTLDMGYGAGMVQIVQMVDGKQELGRKEGEGCTTPYTI